MPCRGRIARKEGDHLDAFDWAAFLEQWSRIVLARSDAREHLLPEVVTSGWLGYPGATEEQIAFAEARLGTRLPPSYRAFLAVSNGWRFIDGGISKLWSTSSIEWFTVRHQDWIDAWMDGLEQAIKEYGEIAPVTDEEYFIYGGEQDTTLTFRAEYLPTALEISPNEPDDSAIYLLNRQSVTPSGEWEAWFFADWLQGAHRYQSFQVMMQAEFEATLNKLGVSG